MTRERPNVRVAVEFCLTEPAHAENALSIVTGLPWLYWGSRGLCGEGPGWLERALARTTAPTVLRDPVTLQCVRCFLLRSATSNVTGHSSIWYTV